MPRTTLSLSTYNLYNLNEPGLPIYSDSDSWSPQEYQKKNAWTSSMISQLNSDVWAFQESWHRESLERVFSDSSLGTDYTLLVPDDHAGEKLFALVPSKIAFWRGLPNGSLLFRMISL